MHGVRPAGRHASRNGAEYDNGAGLEDLIGSFASSSISLSTDVRFSGGGKK